MSSVYLDVNDIVDQVRRRSELKARSQPAAVARLLVITDSDEDTIQIFLQDGITDIANRIGAFGDLLLSGESIIHRLSPEQSEQDWKDARGLLKMAVVNYLLFEWCRSVGLGDLAAEFGAFYEQKLTDYRTNSTKSNFVKPKYRPYF